MPARITPLTAASHVAAVLIVLCSIVAPLSASQPYTASSALEPRPDKGIFEKADTPAALATPSLMFIENVGQFDSQARFKVEGGDRTIWLSQEGIWVLILEPLSPEQARSLHEHRSAAESRGAADAPEEVRRGTNLKLTFPGSNPHTALEPFNPLDVHVSYYLGNDPQQWCTDVPAWGGVRYVDL